MNARGFAVSLVVGGLSFALAIAQAQQPTTPTTPAAEAEATPAAAKKVDAAAVRRLIDLLDAEEEIDRIAAEAELISLGPAALEFLPTPDRYKGRSPQSLKRVVDTLQRLQTSRRLSAGEITLSQKGVKLSVVMKALAEQSGNAIKDMREEQGQETLDPTVDVDFAKTPFWQALDEVCDKAQVAPYYYGEAATIGYVNRLPTAPARATGAAYSGAFRVHCQSLMLDRNFDTGTPPLCRLNLTAAWEPRVQPIALLFGPDGFEALDDKGEKVAWNGGEQQEMLITPGNTAEEMTLLLSAPKRGAEKLASVKAKVRALVLGDKQTFEFTDLSKKDVVQRHGSVAVIFEGSKKVNDVAWELRIRMRFEDPNAGLESYRDWIYSNQAKLTNSKGEEIADGLLETTLRTETEVGVAYTYELPDGPKGCKFQYTTPVAIMDQSFEIELKDLPLP